MRACAAAAARAAVLLGGVHLKDQTAYCVRAPSRVDVPKPKPLAEAATCSLSTTQGQTHARHGGGEADGGRGEAQDSEKQQPC